MPAKYDSRPETYHHIQVVQSYLSKVIRDLVGRSHRHDASKLLSPEVEVFDEYTGRLASIDYGSEEYFECLRAMRPALEHHYGCNDHHPEYFGGGIGDMSLIALLELVCDWASAAQRHENGDVRRSIELNQARFGYGDELKKILLNTIDALEQLEN